MPEITEARSYITLAIQSKSEKYSKEKLRVAQVKYDSAMYHWKSENNRLFFLRDFTKTRNLAQEAKTIAQDGMEKSASIAQELKSLSARQLDNYSTQFLLFTEYYKNIALTTALKNDLIQANLLAEQGRAAYARKDYTTSSFKIDSAAYLIQKVNTYCKETLVKYFENYATWELLAEQTIKESAKNNSVCIIIDKYARKCHVYNKGNCIETFQAELGTNWIGDKKYQGDKRTPEGHYRVVKKMGEKETKYYKALLLNYPNADDQERFILNKKSGHIKSSAKIGGLIEIHGNGGKGLDWTDGCVALSDTDMDRVFQICNPNTTVTIVGSISPLEKIFP